MATDEATTRLLLEAVRCDVRRRVDAIVDRVERDVAALERSEDVERKLRDALAEVTQVMAEGILARLRETRRGG